VRHDLPHGPSQCGKNTGPVYTDATAVSLQQAPAADCVPYLGRGTLLDHQNTGNGGD